MAAYVTFLVHVQTAEHDASLAPEAKQIEQFILMYFFRDLIAPRLLKLLTNLTHL